MSANGQVFNVGSTESVTIRELAERVIKATNSSSELVFVPYERVYTHGIQEMFQRMPATDKIEAAIGWRPSMSLDEIIAELISQARSEEPVPTANA
jgi:UDP-glucose 4-epimerase